MLARYDHICLTVSDLDRSIAFYERYFGLPLSALPTSNGLAPTGE